LCLRAAGHKLRCTEKQRGNEDIMNRTEYLKSLTEQIRNKYARELVAEEITAHIEDQKEAFLLDGKSEEEAEKLAVKEMGNPVEAGSQLDKVHRPKTDVWMLVAMIVLTLAGVIMQSIICLQYGGNASVQNTYHIRTALYNLIGLSVMAVVYFADYRLLYKYIWLIYGAYLAGSFLFLHAPFSDYAHHHLAGQAASILFVPLFAVFCYRLRGQKGAGILKALALLCFNTLLLLLFGAFSSAEMLLSLMACLITLCAASFRGIFGGRRKLQGGLLAASIIGIPALFLADVLLFGARFLLLADYQIMRIQCMFAPAAFAGEAGYQAMLVRSQLSGASLFGQGTIGKVGEFSGAWCDYVLICLASYFGLIAAFLAVAIIAAYFLRALHISFIQKNRLGFLLGFSCSVILILKSIVYVAVNFGAGTTVSIDMPFFTYGLHCAVINFLFMGIILSVYRNTNLLPEPAQMPLRIRLKIERADGK